MVTVKFFVGTIMMGLGALFSVNHKKIAPGAAEFYEKLYTEKNIGFMFKALGVILIVGGAIISFAN